MIGLALVVFTAIFAAGPARLGRQGDRRPAQPLGADRHPRRRLLARARRRRRSSSQDVPGVDVVSPMRFDQANVKGGGDSRAGLRRRPATVTAAVPARDRRAATGDARRTLRDDQVLADTGWAKSHGFKVGDTIQVTTPTGKTVDYKLAGTYENKVGVLGKIVVTNATMTQGLEPARRRVHPRRRQGRARTRSRRAAKQVAGRLPGRQGADARRSSRTSRPTRSTSCSGSSSRCSRCR